MASNFSIGIMQPYFFPYLGHFSLIGSVDRWVVFDLTQYTPKSWMNRNRVLHPKAGWQYVTVPLSHSSQSLRIHQAKLLDPPNLRQSISGKLSHYRRYAPYFKETLSVLDEALSEDDSLVNLNTRGLSAVCRYLDIPFSPIIASEEALELPANLGPGEWALEIASSLGASRYVNPESGAHLFDPRAFERRGIELSFASVSCFEYSCGPWDFIPNLSIIDVLMWNDPPTIRGAVYDLIQLSTMTP